MARLPAPSIKCGYAHSFQRKPKERKHFRTDYLTATIAGLNVGSRLVLAEKDS